MEVLVYVNYRNSRLYWCFNFIIVSKYFYVYLYNKRGGNMKKTLSAAFLLVMILGSTTVSASEVNPDNKHNGCHTPFPCFYA